MQWVKPSIVGKQVGQVSVGLMQRGRPYIVGKQVGQISAGLLNTGGEAQTLHAGDAGGSVPMNVLHTREEAYYFFILGKQVVLWVCCTGKKMP